MRKFSKIMVGLGVAIFGVAIFNIASASAAGYCTGSDVERCVSVFYSGSTNNIVANAEATDGRASGQANHWVSVYDLRLQYKNSFGEWVTLKSVGDYDGWHDESDPATLSRECGSSQEYRAVASFKWKRYGGTAITYDTVSSGSQYISC